MPKPLFKPGCPPGPGRPVGSYGGRMKILLALDELLAEEEEVEGMREALRAYLHKDRIRFFKSIIMPLLPHETKLRIDAEGIIQWQSLLTIAPTPPSLKSIEPEDTGSAPSAVAGDSERPCALPESCSTGAEPSGQGITAGSPRPTTLPSGE